MSMGKRLFLAVLTLFSFVFFQANLSASDSDSDVDTLTHDTMSISKEEIIKSLDNLKKQGQITEADYEKTKKELLGMSDSQVNNIKKNAEGIIRNNPDKALELVNQKKIDVKAVEQQASQVKK